tara:strand:+ start:310 stop:2649 length:2340 start_codon:yes stop_codon:yes gene_type:complete
MEEDNIQQDNALQIGVVNPEAVIINDDDGGVVIDFSPMSEESQVGFNANLAEHMDESELSLLSSDLIAAYDEDRASRSEWEEAYIDGLDLLGVKIEDRSTPFEGATGVSHPILSEAVIRFVSQAMMEIFPPNGPVRTTVIGTKSKEKEEQARRVQDYMNYLLTEEIEEYRPSTEQLLFKTALAGSGFRKVYYDQQNKRPDSIFVPAEDFVVSYETTDLKSSPRYTHVMRKSENFVRRMQLNEFYRDVDIGDPSDEGNDIQTKYNELTGVTEVSETDVRTLLEMHVELDLAGFEHTGEDGEATGLGLPYVVTIDHSSGTILSIRRNYEEADPLAEPYQHFVHYKFQPGLGFYGFGLIHLIGSIAKSSTSILRQLIDAGTLANLPAGFKARGLRIKGDDRPIEPGEFRDIDLPGGAIRDNILPLPFKEPSPTLAQLMGVLVDEGRRIASIADMNIGEGNQEAPVGTTIALIERSMKVMSAVHARLHNSLRREFKLLSSIIKESMPEYPYEVGEDPLIARSDFDERVDIIPVSDPNATSFAQRIMQQQAAMQTASQAPQLYDLRKLHRSFLSTVGIDNVSDIVPDPTEVPAFDPVSENARAMSGAPIKVFSYQDHDSHIAAHTSLMQDPSLQQNPMAKQIQAIISAHISEHMAHKYRNEAQELIGADLPELGNEEAGLSEQEEMNISAQAAQAAAEITGKAQQQAVLEQQMQAAKDPVVQMQQAELQIEQAKIQQKAAEAQQDAQVELQKANMRTQLERERLQQQREIAAAKIQADLVKKGR